MPDTLQRSFRLGKPVRLSAGLTNHEHPAAAPGGGLIAYYAGEYGSIGICACHWDGRLARIASPWGGNSTQPAWHPGGRILAYRHQHSTASKWELWHTDVLGGGLPCVLQADPLWHYKHPSFDAAGRRLAWFSDEGSPNIFHLWIADITAPPAAPDGSVAVTPLGLANRRQLTFGTAQQDCHPVFSPDGTRLLYHVYNGIDENAVPPVTNLWELDIASGEQHALTTGTDQFKHPFYLDAETVVFHHERNSDGLRRICLLELHSGRIHALTSGESNDKHPYPVTLQRGGKSRSYILWASKKRGEEHPGEPASYDIFRARLRIETASTPAGTQRAAEDPAALLKHKRLAVRRLIRQGAYKSKTCKRCPYILFARGEAQSKADLRGRNVKRRVCKRCPARAFMS